MATIVFGMRLFAAVNAVISAALAFNGVYFTAAYFVGSAIFINQIADQFERFNHG